MAIRELIPWRRQTSLLTSPEWSPIQSLQREMNRMFNELWDGGALARAESTGGFLPPIDVVESDKNVDVFIDIPGMAERDIQLNVSDDGDSLTIEGEKKVDREIKAEGIHSVERRFGSFRRSVTLPSRVDVEKVEAVCRHGVLSVRMKKLPAAEQHVKRIHIKSA